MFVLLIGVLGVVTLVNTANATTSKSRAREAATNLSRAVLEGARSLPIGMLTQSNALSAIQGLPGLGDSDSGTPGWQVQRRGITYTVALTVCNVDDPADGVGTDDSTFCSIGTPTSPPDRRPADYKRATVTTSWTDGVTPKSTTEAGIISGSYRGPSILTLTGPTGVYTSTANPGTLAFNVTASPGTDHVNWSIDGNDQGIISGCTTACSTNWNLGEPTGSAPCNPAGTGWVDGTYVVQALAYDADNLTSDSRAVTVQINRCPPLPPTGLEGGETKLWDGVELQWDPSPEEDVIGYHVYKSTVGATGPWTAAAPGLNPDPSQPDCSGLVKTPNCVEPDTNKKVWYALRAVDTDTAGNPREGDLGAALLVDPANSTPGAPGGLGVDSTTPFSIKWDGKSYGDPPPNDYTSFFYIYRDTKNGRPDRYDSFDNPQAGGTVFWTDPDPGTSPHSYWVTAVDNHLAESNFKPDPGKAVNCDASGTCVVGNWP